MYNNSYNDIYYNSLPTDMNSFYSHLNEANFKKVTVRRILELKANSVILNKFLHNEHSGLNRPQRYVRIMNRIKMNPTMFGIDVDNYYAEMYLLFMFSVDPTFEAKIISGECNRIDEIKEKAEAHFGIYDVNLINLECYYIRHMATEKKRKKIEEEIDRRAFK